MWGYQHAPGTNTVEVYVGYLRRKLQLAGRELPWADLPALEGARSTRIFTLAESLGAVESLIEHPGRMTHASTAGSLLEVDPALIRLPPGSFARHVRARLFLGQQGFF